MKLMNIKKGIRALAHKPVFCGCVLLALIFVFVAPWWASVGMAIIMLLAVISGLVWFLVKCLKAYGG